MCVCVCVCVNTPPEWDTSEYIAVAPFPTRSILLGFPANLSAPFAMVSGHSELLEKKALTCDNDIDVSGVRTHEVTCSTRPVPSVLRERGLQDEVTSDNSSSTILFHPNDFRFGSPLSKALKMYHFSFCGYVRFRGRNGDVRFS